MIGVLCKPLQRETVEEFFELFKTPWEYFEENRDYDVVITTVDTELPAAVSAVIACGSRFATVDTLLQPTISESTGVSSLHIGPDLVPIYGELVVFGAQREISEVQSGCEPAGSVWRGRVGQTNYVRLGYDLFEEVSRLLNNGQPIEFAQVPTLDLHIKALRNWILQFGVELLEIPPVPGGARFAVCLTHDIDFVGIRNHFLDHSMWGFVFRATIGALRRFVNGRLPLSLLLKCWGAVLSLPLVFLRMRRDFWEPFEWYLNVEKGLPATYFLIPFKGRCGKNVTSHNASRRACGYELESLRGRIAQLQSAGCEIGVHGLDAWHDSELGRSELERIRAVSQNSEFGIRMHWLLSDDKTPQTLDRAGYAYDSTTGYNETIGFRTGTAQVYRPPGAGFILQLPMHIQDGALFYPQRLNLTDAEASALCNEMIARVGANGGVLTLLWHDRSHGPERFWGGFYQKLIDQLRHSAVWFGAARDVVRWYRHRRAIQFDTSSGVPAVVPPIGLENDPALPQFVIRTQRIETDAAGGTAHVIHDLPWDALTTVVPDRLPRLGPANLSRP